MSRDEYDRPLIPKPLNRLRMAAVALVLMAVLGGSVVLSRAQASRMLMAGYGSSRTVSGAVMAQAEAGTCTVNGQVIADGKLPAGTGGDVTITKGECAAGEGPYKYRYVNIYDGGTLRFVDSAGADIQFYASSILIENNGALIAGAASNPFGSKGGKLTIHLWGAENDQTDRGITCKTGVHCGVPDTSPNNIWGSNPGSTINPTSCVQSSLPGAVMDCFYAYSKLDNPDGSTAYFGRKVLALSYGGTLNLFGIKGSTFDTKVDASKSYKSWLRLKGSLKKNDTTLQVDGVVDWKKDDHIVVTTTDFLPEHSEELIITEDPTTTSAVTTIKFKNADPTLTGVQFPHNGQQYALKNLPVRLGIKKTAIETRAAVALLTRTIKIVSDGDTAGAPFTEKTGNFYGGDTIVRQGFASFQVQGVQFYQLGKGGVIMHYPVHFHMARQTPQPLNPKTSPPITFLKDCSIQDSMTRWVTIHGTQGVTVARNVGYKSIGHGFYLEDGTEVDNKLYSNIGILARPAVDYPDNPRQVPGILSAKPMNPPDPDPAVAKGFDGFPFFSDSNHPSVFWIMNGWNDFEYNMAAGAGTCGACYWFVPGAISGPSQYEHWFGYAGEQQSPPGDRGRAGITPLETFIGNSCTSAMNAFTINSTTATCGGVNVLNTKSTDSALTMLPSPGAISNYKYPLPNNDTYWPHVSGGNRYATRCPAADACINDPSKCTPPPECTSFPRCDEPDRRNCDVTVLDRFTTSFNWAEKNLAAVWMRPQWSLVIHGAITDVINAGLNFVTSGGYSKSDVLTGFWALARKTVFVGSTQPGNPYADESGPFNPFTGSGVTGLKCGPGGLPLYCLSTKEGISIQTTNWTPGQRMFSIYDGPTYQDSDVFLDIHPTYLTSDGKVPSANNKTLCTPSLLDGNPCANAGFMNGGLNGLKAYRLGNAVGCYLPNAAIGWKQPNGFYYAPAFHSTNLYFGNVADKNSVEIRHFVIEPLLGSGNIPCSYNTQINGIDPNECYQHKDNCTATKAQPNGLCKCTTDADCSSPVVQNACDTSKGLCVYNPFVTDLPAMKQEYCFWSQDSFTGFTDIDRETVLNDDDGSLTGLTSQVNNTVTTPTPIATPTPVKTETISVNQEKFFNAPVETTECASDVAANPTGDAKKPPATAKTSPYEYVTTAVFPECALSAPDNPPDLRLCNAPNIWGSACSTSDPSQINTCAGILIYRQFLTEMELADKAPPLDQAKRLMGQNSFQRSGLTVNNGSYYIDTTVTAATAQKETKGRFSNGFSPNQFIGGQKYELYFLYTKPTTTQTYKLWVGKNLRDYDGAKNVLYGHTDISHGLKFAFAPKIVMGKNVWPAGWVRSYDSGTGYLTISFDMSAPEVEDDFDLNKPTNSPLGKDLCQPSTMCKWDKNKNTGQMDCVCAMTDISNPLYKDCNETITDKNDPDFGRYAICRWSVKDLDCPADGCEAFEITMPANYQADDAPDHHRPAPVPFANDKNFNWNVLFNNEPEVISGKQCLYDQAQLP